MAGEPTPGRHNHEVGTIGDLAYCYKDPRLHLDGVIPQLSTGSGRCDGSAHRRPQRRVRTLALHVCCTKSAFGVHAVPISPSASSRSTVFRRARALYLGSVLTARAANRGNLRVRSPTCRGLWWAILGSNQ
jgi:hypothetical protein